MPKFTKIVCFFLIFSLLFYSFPTTTVIATASSCSANVDPHSVAPTTTNNFNFEVINTDSVTYRYIRVTRPSANFTLNGGNGVSAVFNYTVNHGSSISFFVNATAENVQAPSENWIVEVSDSSSGTSPVTCSGNLGTEISGQPPDTTPPVISNINVSDLTPTSATINWSTDEPSTSIVNWGLDESYTDNLSDSNLTSNHSFNLTNLTADTPYHFQVQSVDASNNTSSSGDNTFLTPMVSSGEPSDNQPSPAVSNVGNGVLSPLLDLQSLRQTEKVPPEVKLITNLPTVVKEAPVIVGVASDNEKIFLIEYSVDGGKNWLPVDSSQVKGKVVSFQFNPKNLEDGNYLVLARATDTSGNIGLSNQLTLVVDQLPPLVGGAVVTIGPQVLEPTENGEVETLASLNHKITLSSVGGPTQIQIISSRSSYKPLVFSLHKSPETGLWSGIVSWSEPGEYSLIADSIDGAGNHQVKSLLEKVIVRKPLQVVSGNKTLAGAQATLYYFEPESKSWVVWEASSFSQKNPQITSKTGRVAFLIPSGQYYLKVSKIGYQTTLSNIFTVKQNSPLGGEIDLKKVFSLSLGNFELNFSSPKVENLKPNIQTGTIVKKNLLIGKLIPDFNLTATSGKQLNPVLLLAKPTVLSFYSTWSPLAASQLPILASLQQNTDLNIVPIAVLESAPKVSVYNQVGGYNLDSLVDSTGQTLSSFVLPLLPTHYFVDRTGIIRKLVVGVLSKREIISNLESL